MWVFYESFDPRAKSLRLDLRSHRLPAPPRARPLEAFSDPGAARLFGEHYAKALGYPAEAVTRTVACGPDRPAACRGPGGACPLGFDAYFCPLRCGRASP